MELSQMSDTAILNALFDIAAVEANGSELSWQDERDYRILNDELFTRTTKDKIYGYRG